MDASTAGHSRGWRRARAILAVLVAGYVGWMCALVVVTFELKRGAV